VGVLILLGLFGHLWNQQRASNQTANRGVEPAPAPPKTETQPEATPPRATPRQSATKTATPQRSQVAYVVTHKHRLRDCHGTLTFTRDAVRFESDEPQDSFTVARDNVTVEGDALRIRDKTWHFEFNDAAVRAERLFADWKAGTLRAASRP
jgi:hypothetical protein